MSKSVPQALAEQGAFHGSAWQGLIQTMPRMAPYRDTTLGANMMRHGLVAAGLDPPVLLDGGHWGAAWTECGRPTFQLTHGLAAALLLTDCAKVDAGEMRLPFPSFLVAMPAPDGPITMDVHGAVAEVRWIMVHAWRRTDDNAALDRVQEAWAVTHRERSDAAFLTAVAAVPWRDGIIVRGHSEDGISVFYNDNMPAAGTPLGSWCSAQKTSIHLERPLPMTDRDKVAIQSMLRLVANLCLYLGSMGTDAPHAKKPPVPSAPGIAGPPRVWSVGGEIKLPKPLRDAARAWCERDRARLPWQLRARFVVRGHWRQQPCGPGRQERRQRWIAPHWRGPEAGAQLDRLYSVDNQEKKAS